MIPLHLKDLSILWIIHQTHIAVKIVAQSANHLTKDEILRKSLTNSDFLSGGSLLGSNVDWNIPIYPKFLLGVIGDVSE
jgi:hypothetical protein